MAIDTCIPICDNISVNNQPCCHVLLYDRVIDAAAVDAWSLVKRRVERTDIPVPCQSQRKVILGYVIDRMMALRRFLGDNSPIGRRTIINMSKICWKRCSQRAIKASRCISQTSETPSQASEQALQALPTCWQQGEERRSPKVLTT